ncbi:MAG: ATP cone domain-containing protein, partial [Alphaproteobacteria bacterium]|nr:ATP cone domain-containing protein [Alphaproteobacteria bacterium]
MTQDISERFSRQFPTGGMINIEDIQDQVELGLMRQGLQKVARAYVLYREEHARQRSTEERSQSYADDTASIAVTNDKGERETLPLEQIYSDIIAACKGFSDVDPEAIFAQVQHNLYEGMKLSDVSTAIMMTVRPMIEM